MRQLINRVARFFRGLRSAVLAANASPLTTGAGSLATGYLAQGVTTIYWGTSAIVTSIAGTANNGTTVGVVLRCNEKFLVDNVKLPNGDGVTTTRVQVVDGQQWDVTIRDDTALGLPRIGATVVINDVAGHISTVGLRYSATVVDAFYDTAAKKDAERVITVERLTLVENGAGS